MVNFWETQTSSCPARLTLSFLKMEVSKSSFAGRVAGGADTIRAPTAPPTAIHLRALTDWGYSFENERLAAAKLVVVGFVRVLEEAEIAVEHEEVTAAIFVCRVRSEEKEKEKWGFFTSCFYSIGIEVSLLTCAALVLHLVCLCV